jgi:CHAT domain-containing protein
MLDQTRPHGRRYLVDLVDVSYLPRASAFGALRDRERRAGVDRVLVVADPDPFPGPPLAYSWVEAAAISPLFAMTTTLAGTDATSASVTTAARQADVLHFACHARIDSRQPRRSWLQLADGTTVTLGELLEAPLAQSPLVVLSACDTARIGDRAVEEAIGFETGLLRAGARAVVAALWPVTDRFAALLMLRFYEAWRSERRHPAAALNVAQRWLHAATTDDLLELLSRRIDLDARPDLGWIVHKHSERSDPLLSWAAFRYTGPMSDDDEGPFIG